MLSAAARPDQRGRSVGDVAPGIARSVLAEPAAAAVPLYGPLEFSAIEDEGPSRRPDLGTGHRGVDPTGTRTSR